MAIFRPNPWVNPQEKCQFFDFLNFLFLKPKKPFFLFQNIAKDIFLAYIGLTVRKVGKIAIFGPKPWVNPFGKISIFRLFKLLVFTAQKGVFFVLEYRKTHFPGLYCLKKKVGKMAIFGPKSWVNPFGKMSIFRPSKLLVFIA